MNRKRRRTWVDGAEYGTEKEAAQAAGVSVSAVSEALKAGGRMVKEHMITGSPPPKPAWMELVASGARLFTPGDRKALLRYPPGEGPLYQGSMRWS
jgi:hypothetical protein